MGGDGPHLLERPGELARALQEVRLSPGGLGDPLKERVVELRIKPHDEDGRVRFARQLDHFLRRSGGLGGRALLVAIHPMCDHDHESTAIRVPHSLRSQLESIEDTSPSDRRHRADGCEGRAAGLIPVRQESRVFIEGCEHHPVRGAELANEA